MAFFCPLLLKGFSCRARPDVESITRRRACARQEECLLYYSIFKTKACQKNLYLQERIGKKGKWSTNGWNMIP